MVLYLQGKMFDHLDAMSVTNAAGQEVYRLENSGSGLRHRAVIKNDIGMIVANIEQQPDGKKSCFAVNMFDKNPAAVIRRKPTVRPAYTVEGPGWEVTGSLFSNKYTVTREGRTIAALKVSTLKSEITIDDDGVDPLLAAVVVLTIRIAVYYMQVAGAAAGTVHVV